MIRILIIACFTTCLFSACTNRSSAPASTFGDLDSASVASDTAMQVGMERSYEYQKSLAQNDSVVFDFLAYDRPKGQSGKEWESKFHIIRRTGRSQDTVAKSYRSGTVQSIWLSDLDHNGKEEIMFYTYTKNPKEPVGFIGYEMGTDRKALRIQADLREDKQHYRGMDTFFVYQDKLVRRFPYYSSLQDSIAMGSDWQSYRLSNGKLTLDNERMEK